MFNKNTYIKILKYYNYIKYKLYSLKQCIIVYDDTSIQI